MNLFSVAKTLWALTSIYWLVSALFVKKTIQAEAISSRLFYTLFVFAGVLLLFTNDFHFAFLYQPIFMQQPAWKIAGFAMCVSGLLFAVWSRIILGRNWSGRVTIKEGHELITSGPYAITRNPMYSGFLLSLFGCACIEGLLKDYLGIVILFAGILMKIKGEEKFLKEAFGEKYRLYSSRVKSLVPFVY